MKTNSPDRIQYPRSGGDDSLVHGNDGAAEPGQRRREHVGDQQDSPRRDAQVLEPCLVGPDGAQRLAEGRAQEAVHEPADRAREDQGGVEKGGLEGRPRELEPEVGGPADRHPVAPAGDVEQLLEQGVEHHGEREVEHPEEDVAVAHHEQADDGAHRARTDHAGQQQDGEVHAAETLHQECGAVRTPCEEHGVSERHLAGAQQDHDAEDREPLRKRDGQDDLQPRHGEGQHRHRQHHDGRQEPHEPHVRSCVSRRPRTGPAGGRGAPGP